LLRILQEIQADFEEAKAYAGLWSEGKKKNKKTHSYLDVMFAIQRSDY
jgi:hypothetical protein